MPMTNDDVKGGIVYQKKEENLYLFANKSNIYLYTFSQNDSRVNSIVKIIIINVPLMMNFVALVEI